MSTPVTGFTEVEPPPGAVVAGVDGSARDAAVLAEAAAEARRRGAPLHVLHALVLVAPAASFGGWAYPFGVADAEMARSATVLAGLADRLVVEDLGTTASRPVDNAGNALVRAGDEAAVVVVGVGDRSGVERMLLGSVSVTVAAHAACPVLAVPPHPSGSGGTGRVVVAVDGSRESRAALEEALDTARSRGATLEVLTVWAVEVVDGYVVTEPDTPAWQHVEDRHRRVQERLLAAVTAGEDPGVEVVHHVVKGAVREVLEERSAEADLLVVGNRGRGGFAGKVLGSVTLGLLRSARCPLLVVHAPR
jgi:nucleotide-binding universal stress UspA family protein